MAKLFDLIIDEAENSKDEITIRLGIRLKIGEETTICPVTNPFTNAASLEAEGGKILEDLEAALDGARKAFSKESSHEALGDGISEMRPEELWLSLESIEDEREFVERFNGLGEDMRRAVAEYVLTSCNVFSGRPALFSSQYDAATALLG